MNRFSPLGKCKYLYELSLIDEQQYIRALCEAVLSDDNWIGETDCTTPVIGQICDYAQNITEDDPNYDLVKSVAAAAVTGPQYVTEYTYPAPGDSEYASSIFTIHYGKMKNNEGVTASAGSEAMAQAVYNEIVKINTFWCKQEGFTKPESSISTNRYDIYIVCDNCTYDENDTAAGVTYSNGKNRLLPFLIQPHEGYSTTQAIKKTQMQVF